MCLSLLSGAYGWDRTSGLCRTKTVLCLLSYASKFSGVVEGGMSESLPRIPFTYSVDEIWLG